MAVPDATDPADGDGVGGPHREEGLSMDAWEMYGDNGRRVKGFYGDRSVPPVILEKHCHKPSRRMWALVVMVAVGCGWFLNSLQHENRLSSLEDTVVESEERRSEEMAKLRAAMKEVFAAAGKVKED
jgi:hypothetical protein